MAKKSTMKPTGNSKGRSKKRTVTRKATSKVQPKSRRSKAENVESTSSNGRQNDGSQPQLQVDQAATNALLKAGPKEMQSLKKRLPKQEWVTLSGKKLTVLGGGATMEEATAAALNAGHSSGVLYRTIPVKKHVRQLNPVAMNAANTNQVSIYKRVRVRDVRPGSTGFVRSALMDTGADTSSFKPGIRNGASAGIMQVNGAGGFYNVPFFYGNVTFIDDNNASVVNHLILEDAGAAVIGVETLKHFHHDIKYVPARRANNTRRACARQWLLK